MTPEQVKKLGCDAFAFLKVARWASQCISHVDGVSLGPQGRNSMLTAMTFNFGISLELTLKLLHIKSRGQYPRMHSYSDLFSKLPRSLQEDVETIYSNLGQKLHFAAFRRSNENVPPDPPESAPLNTFELVLTHFDRLKLYLQRYSSEQFDPEEWIEFPYPLTGWIVLLEEISKCSESLSHRMA